MRHRSTALAVRSLISDGTVTFGKAITLRTRPMPLGVALLKQYFQPHTPLKDTQVLYLLFFHAGQLVFGPSLGLGNQ